MHFYYVLFLLFLEFYFKSWFLLSRQLPILKHSLFPQAQQYVPFAKLPPHHLLHTQQAISFVCKICPIRDLHFKTSVIDSLVDLQYHKISHLYKPLNSLLTKLVHSTAVTSWNKDLLFSEALHCILAEYNTTRSFTTNKFCCEQQYKIMHRTCIPYLRQAQYPYH